MQCEVDSRVEEKGFLVCVKSSQVLLFFSGCIFALNSSCTIYRLCLKMLVDLEPGTGGGVSFQGIAFPIGLILMTKGAR